MPFTYKGKYDPSTNTPFLQDGVGTLNDAYLILFNPSSSFIVTRDFGSGPISCLESYFLAYDGAKWYCVGDSTGGGSGSVTSVDITPGTGISATGGPITSSGSITVTNTLPDQTVVLNASGVTQITGTYPNFNIYTPAGSSSGGTVTSVAATPSTGISITGSPITSSGNLIITNTLPDRMVTVSGNTGISITGSYPSFGITNTAQAFSSGTVTQINTASGITGGPITSTGTIGLAPIGANSVLANVSGTTSFPNYFLSYSSISNPNSLILRDANQNASANNFTSKATNVVSAGGTTTLNAASTRLQNLTGTLNQIFQLPDATSLSIGARFTFNNNSSGTLTVNNYSGTLIVTVPSGGAADVIELVASTSSGVWDYHFYTPSNTQWGTSGLAVTGTIGQTSVTSSLIKTNSSGTLVAASAGTDYGTVTSVALSGSTGISISGSPITNSGTIVVTNSLPDQTVVLTQSGTTKITGTYPNFNIYSADSASGTVTSVDGTGSTGITVTGGPITGSGSLIITNTLPDRTVTVSGTTNIVVNGVYPSFGISSSGLTTGAAGSTKQIQYNNAGAFAGSTVANIDTDNNLYFLSTSGSTSSFANSLKIYSNNQTGIDELHSVPFVGSESIMQSSLGQKVTGRWTLNGTTEIAEGFYTSAISTAGAGSFNLRTYDATNLLPNYMYKKYTAAASANTQSEVYYGFTSRAAMIGNNTYGGQAKWVGTFGLPGYVSTQRVFAGYINTFATLTTTVDPSTLLNLVGVGKDAADTTLQIMFNGASGTATKVNTGITPTVNDVYRVTVFLPSSGAASYVTLERFTKSAVTTFNAANSAKIPVAGTLMYMHIVSNSAAASTAPQLAVIHIHEELY